ncbi:A/G-specific adenine glycosylase [Pasteuria penetrans]|uniref:A/G-specific adenine glycosylase n=1 Tax=Pasteuria penetrans TaxID=86005 RepID=UPI0011EEFF97|nr:A/G-specific adenine glycosylase [Pasteuria penetrans]
MKAEVTGGGIRDSLLTWYLSQGRDLPWRRSRDPYAILVSEVMLQQTRVATVLPYYRNFMHLFPTLAVLASAPEDRVLKAWEGLGYYARVRRLHAVAHWAVENHNGLLPTSAHQLRSLPGIGSYTAGAVASIAYGEVVPAVDGNVLRVVARLLGSEEPINRVRTQRQFTEQVAAWLPAENPGVFNQALMELGSLVCLPKRPRCDTCPLSGFCKGQAGARAGQLPVRDERRPPLEQDVVILYLQTPESVWVEKRPPRGLLAGMWGFPTIFLPSGVDRIDRISQFIGHSPFSLTFLEPWEYCLSQYRWRVTVVRVVVPEGEGSLDCGAGVWMGKDELDTLSLPRVYQKVLQSVAAQEIDIM